MTPPPSLPSSSSRLIALLGDPVAHSLSPRIQNAAFRAAEVDGVYLALRCDTDSLPGLLRGIAHAGGGGNVTLPHKEAAARLVDRRTEAVERTGACNTFWLEDGEIRGDNTDVAGFRGAATALLGHPFTGIRVLLLGAGGAARAVLCALADAGADEVVIVNRTRSRAETASEVPGRGLAVRVVMDATALAGEHFDLVVNATSLGLETSDPLPPAADGRISIGCAFDLVYRPGGTTWARHLRSMGVSAVDGSEMLLRQGAAAFRRWWGRDAPVDIMRDALAQSV